MIGYVKYFDSCKKMSFVVNHKKLLKKYTKIWEKIRGLIGKKFNNKPFWGDKYISPKIKSYGDIVYTRFHDKNVPKEKTPYKCSSLIMLDSVIKTGKKYDPQTFLEERKYEITKKKMENLVNDDFDPSSKSDNESDNESNIESESKSDNESGDKVDE